MYKYIIINYSKVKHFEIIDIEIFIQTWINIIYNKNVKRKLASSLKPTFEFVML